MDALNQSGAVPDALQMIDTTNFKAQIEITVLVKLQ